MAEAELLELFEKASKAARKACNIEDGGGTAIVVDVSEEARCTDALRAIGAVDISTSLLLSTQERSLVQDLLSKEVVSRAESLKSRGREVPYSDTLMSLALSLCTAVESSWWKVATEINALNQTILQIGKRLRKLTKHSSMKISKSAQELLQDWRKVVSAKANKSSNSKKSSSLNSDTVLLTTESPMAPAKVHVKSTKVTQIKMEVKVTKNIVKNVVPQACQKVSMVSTTVSSSSTVECTPVIGAIPKALGDSSRDRIREMLVEALAKVWKEATNDDLEKVKKINIVEVAVAVENALFAKLGLSKGKEKAKYRSIMFNIKDEKNPDFRCRVLLGRVKPEAIVIMTTDDMASDHRKKETQDIKAKAMFECERGIQAMASTDQFKCHKCLQRKTTYFQMQTRSADEPMTTFITCLNCNAHWKF